MYLLWGCAALLAFSALMSDAYELEIKIGALKDKKETARDYLFKYGYFANMCSSKTCKLEKDQERKIISDFQYFANLKQTGEIDDATIAQMRLPRCGKSDQKFPDFTDPRIINRGRTKRRKKRYNPQGSKWQKVIDKKPLTWRYAKPNSSPDAGITKDLPKADVKRILMKAMSLWTIHTDLRFVEDMVNEPDIWIYFGDGGHGDPYPFDGPGRTLAHAFYPLNNKGLSGDMHFDDAERYTEGTAEGRNLLWVATHELGHSLGLAHSNVREAVMYPWYTGYQGDNFALKRDDVLGIQAIYGKKSKPVTAAPPTAAPTTTTTTTAKVIPKECPKQFTAAWYTNGVMHLSTPTANYKLSERNELRRTYGFRETIDAAFSMILDGEESVIVFSGDRYYVCSSALQIKSGPFRMTYSSRLPNGPLPLYQANIKKVVTAMKWKRNGKLYLFFQNQAGEGLYSRFNLANKKQDRDWWTGATKWRTSERWSGLPKGGPDAAVSSDRYGTYFFLGDRVMKYNDWGVRPEYERHVSTFLKC